MVLSGLVIFGYVIYVTDTIIFVALLRVHDTGKPLEIFMRSQFD